MSAIWKLLATASLLGSAGGCRAEPASTPQAVSVRTAPSGLALVPLQIHSGGRVHDFTVEVARTSDEQSRGLMYRESLGASEGMIFPFPSPRMASFWMRNTLIPLDLIFIRSDGTIANIAANAVPHSEASIPSVEPVTAVLELRGGRAAELGLAPGDRVSWRN